MNITEINEAEKTLSIIFEAASDGILVADTEDKKFLFANKASCRMLGYNLDEIKKIGIMGIHPEKDLPYVLEQFEKQRKQEIILALNIPVKRKDGSIFYTDISSGPMQLNGKQYLVGIFRDITEKKRVDKELFKIRKLESVGVFAGGIAHDFNNILAAILGNLELAEKYIDPTNEAYPLLDQAKKASIRAKGLTQQLLTFAKGGDPVKQTSSIGKTITDSSNFVLHGSSVVCNYNIPDNLWQVDVDTGQISQVMQNIIINARHAMPDGGVIEVCCENIPFITKEAVSLPDQKYVKITIVDSGSGIPEKYIDKIFDPYFSTKQEGGGLGLAICYSIISKHDGSISVQSETNIGTTFTIYLPASQKTSQDTVPSKQGLIEARHKATIMVMDDESMVRDVSKQMLEQFGHEVVLAENGHEAIELYNDYSKANRFIDIIIMDLTIPGEMGGKDAVREILKINQDAKVVVASGYSNDPVMAHYQDYGFKASIAKPFRLSELNKLINTVLE
jgi:PAS domain S-box-containing protein